MFSSLQISDFEWANHTCKGNMDGDHSPPLMLTSLTPLQDEPSTIDTFDGKGLKLNNKYQVLAMCKLSFGVTLHD